MSVVLSKMAQDNHLPRRACGMSQHAFIWLTSFFFSCRKKGGLIYFDNWKPHLDHLSPEPEKSRLGQKVPGNMLAANQYG